MSILLWIILAVSHFLTLIWYFLIKRDVSAYMLSQTKVLGFENQKKIDTPDLRFLLKLYAVVILVITLGFTLFLLTI